MKIGRNELCPCGSGKKYKKCCLSKAKEDTDKLIDPFTYHDNYIHTKKVKTTRINKKLLNIHDNKKNLSIKSIIDDYLEIKFSDLTIKHELVGDVVEATREPHDFNILMNGTEYGI